MNVSFTENAWEDYLFWQRVDKKIVRRYLQFASQSHFASVLKKITGQNPQEYRISNKRFS